MKGWIELHTFYHGEPILINTANMVKITLDNKPYYWPEDEE